MEVNNQPHYATLGIEPIDIMRLNMSVEQYRGFLMGNIIKYSHRTKGTDLEDMRKLKVYARWLELSYDHTQIDEQRALHALLEQLPKDKYRTVAATGRGGLWVASMVAYYLDLPQVYLTENYTWSNSEEVLFVDDIADTGETIKDVKMDTAVLCKRHSCPIEPTYVGKVIEHDSYVKFTFQGDNDARDN